MHKIACVHNESERAWRDEKKFKYDLYLFHVLRTIIQRLVYYLRMWRERYLENARH